MSSNWEEIRCKGIVVGENKLFTKIVKDSLSKLKIQINDLIQVSIIIESAT
jgi:hypothetical protein